MTTTDLKSFKLDGPLVDLDETLVELFKREQPELFGEEAESKCEIVFDLPDSSPNSQQRAVSFFLYAVRENRELRSTEWPTRRIEDGRRVEKTPPPARVDCSYLVTAWAVDTFHEHWLLGQVMTVLLRHRRLPAGLLQGKLRGQEPPVRALPLQSGPLQSPSDFWQALKGKPKAALDYTLTISVDVHKAEDVVKVAPVTEAALDRRPEVVP